MLTISEENVVRTTPFLIRSFDSKMIRRKVGAILLLLFLISKAHAQSGIDGSTPLGLAPGAPAGSYALSDFESVNLFNGSLNFQLPLLPINGRGAAGYKITHSIERKWTVERFVDGFGQSHYFPYDQWWVIRPGYSPGILQLRRSGVGSMPCLLPGPREANIFSITLTRLTFIAPDGTEFELRDKLTGGQPLEQTCPGVEHLRGREFVTADGTSATFISDQDIRDIIEVEQGGYSFPVSGYLVFRDGTRYRIDNDNVSWIRDRNGNQVSFANTNGADVIDSLNRQIIIEGVQDSPPYGLCARITYKGFGGANRFIRVSFASLSSVLRPNSGYSLQTYLQLFPQLNGASSTAFFNPNVVSNVWLPDGRSYRFYYNPYGELARVELPTGGAIEYDYAAGVVGNRMHNYLTNQFGESFSGIVLVPTEGGDEYAVYRRVVERRVYSNGSTLEGKTTYSRPERFNSQINNYENLGYVEEDSYDPAGMLLSRSRHYYLGSTRLSFSQSAISYPAWNHGREYQTDLFDSSGATLLRRVSTEWAQRAPVSWYTGPPAGAPPNDPRVVATVTTLADANLVSKQTFGYDQYNNQTDVYEYDFGAGAPGSLVRHTHTDYVTFNNGVDYAADTNIHIRSLPLRTQVFDAGEIKRAETSYEYDLYDNSPNHAPLIDRPGISGLDSGFTTGCTTRGNVTKTFSALLNNSGGVTGWINSHTQYDIAGNVVKAIDGRTPAGITTLDYSDRFGSPGDDAQQNTPHAELNGQTSYAFATKVTNALGHTTYTKYDYYLGKPVNSEDANGVVSSVEYDDALDRPTRSIQARYVVGQGVLAVRRQTAITYDDANHVITTTSDRDTFNDNILTSKSYYDELGRNWRVATYEGSTWSIKDTQFDALGRVSKISNPYRAADPGSASPPSGLWTTTEYDALGRAIRVTTPDGAHVDTAYNGNQVTVTDQAGRQRRSETDALGRLIKVTEDPGGLNYDTTYLYDVLGNLRKVTQGTQIRCFAYDSLSRLIRARNLEQDCNPNLPPHTDPYTGGSCWATAYSYDANGNLVSKTDARNIKTEYEYDALNRNTKVDYSDTAVKPDISRGYDKIYPGGFGLGRLWYSYAGGSESTGQEVERTDIDNYDALGRPTDKRQFFKKNGVWSEAYYVGQTYDLADNVKSITYPSGRTVNYSYDQAGRLSSFSGNLGGSQKTYADTIRYSAAGQMVKERFGTNTSLYHNNHYNNRLQMVAIRFSDSETDAWAWNRGAIDFFYGSTAAATWDRFANDTDNNGNLRRQVTWVQLAEGGYVIPQLDDYYYDALNRIGAVRERQRNENGQWANSVSQAFSYDQWGNRTLDLTGGSGAKEVAWVDDALPPGAVAESSGGDNWTWVTGGPTPYSGSVSHQSAISSGLHQHFFTGATPPLQINAGDRLYAYIYLDPANMPSEVMLQWFTNDSGWEHRAYWGANIIPWGTPGTASRQEMGPLPAAGQWVRLEVDASAVGLEGKTVNGMAFTLFDGRANWDRAGKVGPLYGVPPLNNNVYTVEASTNRLTSVNGLAMSYDAAGNLTNDPSTGGTMIYDAENRLLTATKGGAVSRYTYDAEGRRVRRITGGQETWQVYGIGGELLAEYQLVSGTPMLKNEYGYRGGQLLVVWDVSETGDRQLQWLVQDHLGSTRMVVDRSGSLGGVRRHDFAPFGEELSADIGIRSAALGYGADSTRQKFTGYEHDNETGLDFAQARYFSSVQGRFTSVDPLIASERVGVPQSWNRYSYVLNNPLKLVDPTGMMDDQNKDKKDYDQNKEKTVVVVFFGGNAIYDASKTSSGRDMPSTTAVTPVQPGRPTDGIGETGFDDIEAGNIAQAVKNEFPDADVRLAGPDAQPGLFNELAVSPPGHILIQGYSAGAISAVALTNNLTDRGIQVDQLTTVDPTPTRLAASNVAPLRNTDLIGNAVNYHLPGPLGGKTVNGARNVVVDDSYRQFSTTRLGHRTVDDVTSGRVIGRITSRLREIYKK